MAQITINVAEMLLSAFHFGVFLAQIFYSLCVAQLFRCFGGHASEQ
jgi:hypothetical protein